MEHQQHRIAHLCVLIVSVTIKKDLGQMQLPRDSTELGVLASGRLSPLTEDTPEGAARI